MAGGTIADSRIERLQQANLPTYAFFFLDPNTAVASSARNKEINTRSMYSSTLYDYHVFLIFHLFFLCVWQALHSQLNCSFWEFFQKYHEISSLMKLEQFYYLLITSNDNNQLINRNIDSGQTELYGIIFCLKCCQRLV